MLAEEGQPGLHDPDVVVNDQSPQPERQTVRNLRPLESDAIRRQAEALFGLEDSPTPTTVESRVNVERYLKGVSPAERASFLYTIFESRRKKLLQNREILTQNPEAPVKPPSSNLLALAQGMWRDEAVKTIFVDTYEHAAKQWVEWQSSTQGAELERLERGLAKTRAEYNELNQEFFLNSTALDSDEYLDLYVQIRDRVLDIQEKQASLLARERPKRSQVLPETSAVLAHHQYDHLREMQRELRQTGFIWFDSMRNTYQTALLAMLNGGWPLYIGEAGTGKSALAKETALTLTGDRPLLVACTSRTNERHLIETTAIAGGDTYQEYGAALQAATGYGDSRPASSAESTHGRVVRLDELFKLGEDSTAFAFIKELAQLRPGDLYRNREVLQGFKVVATTNPAGARYNNPEPNPALIREFTPIYVDYLQMQHEQPEVFELMLAALLDDNGLMPGVFEAELAPAYQPVPGSEPLPDGRTVKEEQQLIENSADTKHGFLYRLSFAVRALQDAFIYGNGGGFVREADSAHYQYSNQGQAKDGALRLGAQGTIDTSGELLTLSQKSITPDNLISWMQNYPKRLLLTNHAIGQTGTFVEYMQAQLRMMIQSAAAEDRDKIQAVFDHYHLFDEKPDVSASRPLTRQEIGALSPRVPRAVTLDEPTGDVLPAEDQTNTQESVPESEAKQAYETVKLLLEDSSEVFVHPTEPLRLMSREGHQLGLPIGSRFLLTSSWVTYKGIVHPTDPRSELHGFIILQNQHGLNEVHEVKEIQNLGSEFWQLEELRQDVIRKQYEQQQAAYQWVGWLKKLPSGQLGFETGGREYPMPSFERVLAHLSDSPEFIQTLRTKEKQGFSKVVITPFALPARDQIDAITTKVKALDGTDTYRSELWKKDLGATFNYFTSLDAAGTGSGGVTKAQILSAPGTYQFLIDGYMVSVMEDMDDLPLQSESPAAIGGRTPIKGGETGIAYQQKFATDPQYKNEQPVIPDEWFARFAQVFHEKYGAPGKKIVSGASIFDTKTAAWFVDTLASGSLPYAYWDADVRQVDLGGISPGDADPDLAPRASVRKQKA